MALYALFFWAIFFFMFISYLYLRFLRNEIDRADLAFTSVISGAVMVTLVIASLTWNF